MTTKNESNIMDKTTQWYESNKTMVNRVLIGLAIILLGIWAYNQYIIKPKEIEAGNASFMAEQYFMDGNYPMALSGQGNNVLGFLKIIDKYSGTKEANLAEFYAGVCYLNMKEYKKSIDHLKKFNGNGSILEYRAYGCIGDAYAELGKNEDAIKYYTKASSLENDDVNAPIYLMRKGLLQEKAGKTEEARKTYAEIRRSYPNSIAGSQIDKYLARTGELSSY